MRGLREAAAIKRKLTLDRARAALQELCTQGAEINFNKVAKQAHVSTAWLYKNMREEIENLRVKPKIPSLNASSIVSLQKRIIELETENQMLRHKLNLLQKS